MPSTRKGSPEATRKSLLAVYPSSRQPSMEKLWTLKQFASFIGLSYGHATRLAKKGKFKHVGRRVGSQWRFYLPTVRRVYGENRTD